MKLRKIIGILKFPVVFMMMMDTTKAMDSPHSLTTIMSPTPKPMGLLLHGGEVSSERVTIDQQITIPTIRYFSRNSRSLVRSHGTWSY